MNLLKLIAEMNKDLVKVDKIGKLTDLNPLMANRWDPPPPQINFSSQWGELLFHTNFVFVGTPLRHLSMKKIFRLDLPCLLERKVLGPLPTSPWALSNNLPIFLTMKMHLISTKLSMSKVVLIKNYMTAHPALLSRKLIG